ncbi:hydroxymethylglutaryl-CoA lyase [Usitatibacter palustris]|uniref:Hydroxymethylglutaryl-CoA lyase YngG n=1 Tax=Usitatibacter palustris TaxID=2732487 RepID=A0A6M4HBG3_9PROT|nr:hydroxymethylglutaryl-CoA lyase [Usitatibacter palustris]QJR16936.1 Hydroxymethylglutaryl-CoA lyase YngG [Usitatibacter palustris]
MRLYINDVAVRDGFQIEKTFIPTKTKVEVIDQLSRTGLHKIEVTSFVSAKAVPALADANEVLSAIERVPGVLYVVLVPNIRGVQNAAATAKKPDEVNGVMSASETHNRANINRTHEQSLAELPTMVKVAHEAGMKISMSLSTTFGCPFEGHVAEDVVLRFVEAYRNAGVDAISLADTTGMANPRQVEDLTRKVLERFPAPDETFYTLHFHNTRGMGLANVVAGIAAGVRSFDGSISGLGGCPFAPGATGNICTEDMVNMLEDMGYDTRVDLAKLLAVARNIPAIVGHEVPGQVMKAGVTMHLHDLPEYLRT